ncbi:MAG: glutathione S-transferase family protein [Rhodospirillaceae bacterium]|nr:glutathione S-transferase family protein [Rhodospirillaceae bacterium]MBT4487447.1 glutathione S-transferase family protein [Rhodospirillaceae bacterium]MBT5193046.1 glutathione S-transferase family protein [Rhodospirillaceae bacterium]MBT5898846.1 glutathione S-transferase family protein [Rhodospirillaceae bacterium]MBT7760289.1 glutathione S-transferase family protein [Rhodospirillaceae bacterium]
MTKITVMTELIMHHYDFSNYSEKVRLTLGFKGLVWRSVIIPPIAPKPLLTPLTGGYRRTPVLQIGADIYCDTSLILRELERRFPTPTLFPPALSTIADAITYWAENRLFRPISLYVSGSNLEHLPEGLQADRSVMRGLPPPSAEAMARAVRRNAPLVRVQLRQVEAIFADGRTWIAGDVMTAADLAVYHALWFFTARTDLLQPEIAPFECINEWMGRMRAIGHGEPTPLSATEALDIAADATPEAPRRSQRFDEDVELGTVARIRADDYGRDAVEGELIFLDSNEIVLRRDDPQLGEVAVHFPRLGYDLRPISGAAAS